MHGRAGDNKRSGHMAVGAVVVRINVTMGFDKCF